MTGPDALTDEEPPAEKTTFSCAALPFKTLLTNQECMNYVYNEKYQCGCSYSKFRLYFWFFSDSCSFWLNFKNKHASLDSYRLIRPRFLIKAMENSKYFMETINLPLNVTTYYLRVWQHEGHQSGKGQMQEKWGKSAMLRGFILCGSNKKRQLLISLVLFSTWLRDCLAVSPESTLSSIALVLNYF